MMQRALEFLHNYWQQLFAYRQDGLFTIDNNIAERDIRQTTVGRKNTCSMMGISAKKYFKMFFCAIIDGGRNYANLLPMTIGIK